MYAQECISFVGWKKDLALSIQKSSKHFDMSTSISWIYATDDASVKPEELLKTPPIPVTVCFSCCHLANSIAILQTRTCKVCNSFFHQPARLMNSRPSGPVAFLPVIVFAHIGYPDTQTGMRVFTHKHTHTHIQTYTYMHKQNPQFQK